MAPARTISRRLPSGRRLNASTTLIPGSSSRIKAQALQSRPRAEARTGHEHVERAVVLEQLAHRAEARARHDLGTRPKLVGHVLDLLGELLTSVEDEDLWVPQRRSSLVVAGVRDLGLFPEDVEVVPARCRSGGGGLVADAGQVEVDAGGRRAEDDLSRRRWRRAPAAR